MRLRLMSYNIRFGGTGREKPIGEVIRECRPDVVLLQEATDPRAVEKIADEAGMKYLGSKRDHSVGYVSRLEVERVEWRELPQLRRPFMQLGVAGTSATLFGVHLSAIHSNWTERKRTRELKALLHCIAEHRDEFHLLGGDFNTLAPGEKLDMSRLPLRLRLLAFVLGGRIRHDTIQVMLDEGYIDGYRLLCTDDGFTFPTWDPHVRLDYVFVPAEHIERVASIEVIDDLPLAREASDHFPLVAEIELP